MTFQGVPWAVGGGAENPPEAARLLAYVGTRSERGVVLPGDCEGREMAVPDNRVRVMSGGVVIPNNKSNADAETYLGRNPEQDAVAIAPTGAGETRSDFVYARIADPQYVDEPAPPDVATGPYIYPEVIAGVDPSTRTMQDVIDQGLAPVGRTGLELCRVDMPESTGTVTQALIADLRRIANPRQRRSQFLGFPATGEDLTSASYVVFPSAASWSVEVPEWATHVILKADTSGVRFDGNVLGRSRMKLGSEVTGSCPYNFDVATAGQIDRSTIVAAGEIAVPASLRGTTQTLTVEARRDGGATDVHLSAGGWITVAADVEFIERAEPGA